MSRASRVTARKAVLLLIDEGLLETRPRWGTFVAERH
jgi:DNA-binding GntR family transcriptional regulator